MSGAEVVVGRIGRAHGVKGEVSVEPRTDEPGRRFAVGAVLRTEQAAGRPGTASSAVPATLTVTDVRRHQSRLLVTFEQVTDRNHAEGLRGVVLTVSVDPAESPEDPEEYYDHQLVGLRVVTTDGRDIGEVREVLHSAAQDLLAVVTDAAVEVLVPFVSALVPTVDLAAGHVVVQDRPGLLGPLEDDPGEQA